MAEIEAQDLNKTQPGLFVSSWSSSGDVHLNVARMEVNRMLTELFFWMLSEMADQRLYGPSPLSYLRSSLVSKGAARICRFAGLETARSVLCCIR